MSYIKPLTLPPIIFSHPAISILLPIASGWASGFTGMDFIRTRLPALRKPPLYPPEYVFGPVWTILYALMGYASFRAWHAGMASLDPVMVEDVRRGATLYTLQLALNLAYTPLFFTFAQPVAGLVDMVCLDAVAGYLAFTWSKVDVVATYCLVPYLSWLAFATYLTFGTGYLNRWSFNHGGKVGAKKK